MKSQTLKIHFNILSILLIKTVSILNMLRISSSRVTNWSIQNPSSFTELRKSWRLILSWMRFTMTGWLYNANMSGSGSSGSLTMGLVIRVDFQIYLIIVVDFTLSYHDWAAHHITYRMVTILAGILPSLKHVILNLNHWALWWGLNCWMTSWSSGWLQMLHFRIRIPPWCWQKEDRIQALYNAQRNY